jgi:purine nucleoside phosphorylase
MVVTGTEPLVGGQQLDTSMAFDVGSQVWPCHAMLQVLHNAAATVQAGGSVKVVVSGPRFVRS